MFTIGTSFGILKSDSTTRRTITSIAHSVGDLVEGNYIDPISIASGVVEQAISFGGVTTAKVLYIRTTQDITVVLNRVTPTGGEGFELSKDGVFLSLGTEITTLHVSNSSGSIAYLEIYVAGE
jgi:hypothetical protein